MDLETRTFILNMEKNESNDKFVVISNCTCENLVQLLTITNNFEKAYGCAMKHILLCEEKVLDFPCIAEDEDGIVIPYGTEKDTDYIYIIKYKEEE